MSDLTHLVPGEKILLQGNEAIARGALEAGVAFAAAYPGNPSSEILETLADSAKSAGIYAEWSANEKVALEAAAGASFAGVRAMASMKQNGVNVAQDFITNLTISGTGSGGLVLVTCDDPAAISSTNEEDSRFIARLATLPLLEPTTPQEALEMMRLAFELSEKIGNLVVFRSLSRLSHTRAGVIPGPLPDSRPKPHWKKGQGFFTTPVIPKHVQMQEKLAAAGEFAREKGFNSYDGPNNPDLLVIASGNSVLYAGEAREMTGLTARVGILKLGCTWPLERGIILENLARAPRILFVEEIDPWIERDVMAIYAGQVAELGPKVFHGKDNNRLPSVGELTPGIIAGAMAAALGAEAPALDASYQAKADELAARLLPFREFGFCAGCPHRASFWSIKQALALDGREGVVSGDIGCYTLGARSTGFKQVDSVHCMGSGTGVASGLGKLVGLGFDQPVVNVVGDSTFFHAALPGLVNARWNQSEFVLIVLDNSATAMTGFQPHPGTGQTAASGPGVQVSVEDVLDGIKVPYRVVDPYDLASTQEALYDTLQETGGVRALIFRRTCALVQNKRGGHPYRMEIDHDICRGGDCGCNRFCSRVFKCPGLNFDPKLGKAVLDEVVCVGCGVCAQICPAGAIKAQPRDKEAAA